MFEVVFLEFGYVSTPRATKRKYWIDTGAIGMTNSGTVGSEKRVRGSGQI